MTYLSKDFLQMLRSPLFLVVVFLFLFLSSFCFFFFALSAEQKFVNQIIYDFYYTQSALVFILGILVSCLYVHRDLPFQPFFPPPFWRTWVYQKLLVVTILLVAIITATSYLPLYIVLSTEASLSGVTGGSLSMVLMAVPCAAMGILASAVVSRSLVLSLILGGSFLCIFLIPWMLTSFFPESLASLLHAISFHNQHFQNLVQGQIRLEDLVYYGGLTVVFCEWAIFVKRNQSRSY